VVANWRHEVERFAPELRALVHHGNSRLTGDAFIAATGEHDLIITSYGTARRDIELLKEFTWSHLILDEAQNIKTPSAKQTQAVRRLRADNRIALTGTPVENRLSELWSIMEYLNPGYLGRQEHFRQRYIVPIERYNDNERTDELRRLVQPFLLRRLKSDPTIISDLPEKNEMVVYCSLTREQARLYETTVQESLAELNRTDGIQRRGLVLALLTKLKQITNHPAHFLKEEGPLAGRSGKLSRLSEMLDEALSVGDRALIFTQFVEMGHLLQHHLGDALGIETLFLHGSTPATQRDKMVQAFQSDDGPPVFVLSLRAGGAGLNLTKANHVFHYDRWWNPAVENQATDRAFRIGQQRNVQVHKFVVAGTLEERINDLIESKQALAQSIVGSGEEWLTELDTDQLRDLLTLRYDAIEDE
jgi:SNF2 family DNA or RNA helicase